MSIVSIFLAVSLGLMALLVVGLAYTLNWQRDTLRAWKDYAKALESEKRALEKIQRT